MFSKAPDHSFYERFEQQLEESQKWPGHYLFKFIVKSNTTAFEQIQSIFEGCHAKFAIKDSSKKTYQSISIKVHLNGPKDVIKYYKEVLRIENVIAL